MNWKRFLHREAADAEQQEELEFYVEVTAEEYVERGMNPEAARAAARRKLGNTTLIREEIYRMNTVTFTENVLRTVRHTVRLIRTHPGFVLTVVLSLALGIGATTTIFSVVHGILIQPLPYPQADELLGIHNRLTIRGQVYEDAALSPGMYAACRDDCRIFRHFGVWSSGTATVTGTGDPEQVATVMVTQGVLPAFGVPASLGRWFSSEDDSPAGARTAILSHGYWQRRFGGDRQILGRTVVIDFVPHEIVGVMPRDFRFVALSPDLFLAQRLTSNRANEFSYNGIGRLKPGLSVAQANEDIARVWKNWARNEGVGKLLEELAVTPNARPLKNDVIGNVGMTLRILMGALGLLMLLVCANVANLVLVRAQARQQEFAIRAALGAGWGRIAWEQIAECLTLGLMGGTLGLGLAYFGVRLLVAIGPADLPRLGEITLGPAVVAFALLCALGTSLLFGTVAVVGRRVPPRIGNARGATAAREQLRGQRVLVVGQIAMALVLLVASGLMVRTLLAIQSVEPGFTRPDQIQMARISLPAVLAREPDHVIRSQKDMVDRLAAIPGVAAVGFASALPLENNRNGVVVAVEGVTASDRMPPNRRFRHASPGLFAAQGSRLLYGRDFTWDDVFDERRLAIVSENMARESWGEPREAIGKRIRIGRDGPLTEVIGVVEDIHADGLHQPAPATVYARAGVETAGNGSKTVRRTMTVAIRSSRAGNQAFLREVAAAVHAVHASVPLADVRTLEDAYRRSMAQTSFTVTLIGIAAAMALALAVVGVYGVLAYAVAKRRHEVGIRLALGAQPGAVRALFVRQGLLLTLLGGILGLVFSATLSRWISPLLYDVTALDPLTYAISGAALAGGAILASVVPASRAASVDPMETLRSD
jgi:putative ABC transport system permease protein